MKEKEERENEMVGRRERIIKNKRKEDIKKKGRHNKY
jgi:hypothetical protein